MKGHLLLFAPHQGVHDVAAAGVNAAVTEAPLGRFTHHETLRVTDPTVAAARGVPPTLEAAAHSAPEPLVILVLKLELPGSLFSSIPSWIANLDLELSSSWDWLGSVKG